jgi:plastocyanin
MRTRWASAVVLSLGLVLAACSSGGDDNGGGSGGSGGGGGSGDVQLTIKDFSFDPSTIRGSAGETLSIEVTNEDSTEHSFTLDDDSVSQDFEGGDGGTVEVTLPDSAGSVGWHCEFHPDTMKGTIEVS